MNKFSKIVCVALVVIMLFAISVTCYAHNGNTDSKGGHYDSSTGTYHYHHGYPAHQHTGGVCPYDYDDKTSSNSGYSSSSNSGHTSSSSSSNDVDFITVVVWIFLAALIGLGITKIIKSVASEDKEGIIESFSGFFTLIAFVSFFIVVIASFFA